MKRVFTQNDYKENIKKIINLSYKDKVPHIPSALSQLMYFQYLLPKVKNFDWVAGKQFGWPAYRIFYKELEIKPPYKNIFLNNKINSEFKYVEETLGNSLGVSIGMALTQDKPIWINLPDSVFQMGRVLEALPLLNKFNSNILITVDFNNTTRSKTDVYYKDYIKRLFEINNIQVIQMDAANPDLDAIDIFVKTDGPRTIIFETIKGYGVDLFRKNIIDWHYKELDDISYGIILKELA